MVSGHFFNIFARRPFYGASSPDKLAFLTEKFHALLDGSDIVASNAAHGQALDDLLDFITIGGNRKQHIEQLDILEENIDRLVHAKIENVAQLVNIPVWTDLPDIYGEELNELREKAIEWQRNYGIDVWRICLLLPQNTSIDSVRFIEEASGVIEPIIAELNQ